MYGLFSHEEGFSQHELWVLRHSKARVFEWLRDLTHWIAVLRTLEAVKAEVSTRLAWVDLVPNYSKYSFFWVWWYGCLDAVVKYPYPHYWTWPPSRVDDTEANQYRFHRSDVEGSYDFLIYLTSQVDEAIRMFFPGIKQTNKMTYCESPDHAATFMRSLDLDPFPVICREVDGQWLCQDCEEKARRGSKA